MRILKEDMAVLQEAPPPPDFTALQIKGWLEGIKTAPDANAVHLLIERIDVKNKTDISASSTLASVLGTLGWGSRI